eukprot:12574096-Ditylum_brightwellii.AAC.1
MNKVVDADASNFMDTDYIASSTPPVLSLAKATLTVGGVVVTSKIQEVLRYLSSCADIYSYICTKTGWT